MVPSDEVSIEITVPSCSCCAAKIEQEVSAVLGVPKGAMRFVVPVRAQLHYDPRVVQLGQVVNILRDRGCEILVERIKLGVPARPAMQPAVWREKLKRLSGKLEGIVSASINFGTSRITVDYLPGLISPKEIREGVISWGAPHPDFQRKGVSKDETA